MGTRISSHKIETNTKDNVRRIINTGNLLFRELSDRDYGIDAIIECFDDEIITGKVAFLQLKGTSDTINQLKNRPVISCQISTSNAQYAKQNNIPVILIYSSLKDENSFYYLILQDVKFDKKKLIKQKQITVHIPRENKISNNPNHLQFLINEYY